MPDEEQLPIGILEAIRRALAEDVGPGDATTQAILPPGARMQGRILAKQAGVVAGLDVAAAVYREVDPGVDFQPQAGEGEAVADRRTLALVSGPGRALLTAERTALNFLGRMSGIATLTRRFVEAVAGTRAVILDTRKTVPGLRLVDKLAVRRGGGRNHRLGLYDMILIKDNHIDFAGSLEAAVRRARAAGGDLPIEVETRTLQDVDRALALGVERILLDNMDPETMAEAVRRRDARLRASPGSPAGTPLLEASGNVSLETVRRVAETGVDFISVGALTHSAPVFDVSFDYLRGAER